MSRIGKQPIVLPKGVEVKLGEDMVEVKGPKGTLQTPMSSLLNYELTEGLLTMRATLSTASAVPSSPTASKA